MVLVQTGDFGVIVINMKYINMYLILIFYFD